MLHKDRYTLAFLWLIILAIASILFFRYKKGYAAAACGTAGIAPLLFLITRSARVHLIENQSGIAYKGENDCGFTDTPAGELDGIRLRGQRYKLVNGADVYINAAAEIKPCGPGTALMQRLGGGPEPHSIQKDD